MKLHRGLMALVPVVVLVLLLAMPAVAAADDGSGRFSLFGSVNVAPGETVYGDVGSIFSSVSVQGTVTGNVFSLFSSISISGNARVDGTATSVFSSVAVLNNAVVRGNVTSVFSTIHKDAAARIEGSQMSGPASGDWPTDVRIDLGDWGNMRRVTTGPGYWVGRVFGAVFSALFLAAVSILTVVIFPRRVQVVRETLVNSPWSSLGVGFLGLLFAVPVGVITALCCIGLFVLLGTFLATLLGVVAMSLWIGDRVTDTASARDRSPVMDVAVGALILSLAMGALDIVPIIGWMSGLIWFGIFSASFGAVLLSRFGSMPTVATTPVAPLAPRTTAEWPTPEAPMPAAPSVAAEWPTPPQAPEATETPSADDNPTPPPAPLA